LQLIRREVLYGDEAVKCIAKGGCCLYCGSLQQQGRETSSSHQNCIFLLSSTQRDDVMNILPLFLARRQVLHIISSHSQMIFFSKKGS